MLEYLNIIVAADPCISSSAFGFPVPHVKASRICNLATVYSHVGKEQVNYVITVWDSGRVEACWIITQWFMTQTTPSYIGSTITDYGILVFLSINMTVVSAEFKSTSMVVHV